jgi:hypothetical protein
MSRRTGPDHRDPDAFAGLTQRRRDRGLPTGRIEQGALAAGLCICGPDDDPNDHRRDCPLWRIETRGQG